MRQKANIYLPPELLMRYQAEAERDGLSLSAHLVRRLSMRDQIDELQDWMAGRFDRVDERLDRVSAAPADDRLLALVGLEKLPREVLLGVLRDVKEELAKLNTKQREHYSAKGRELLARTNGAAK
jgi:hypothetical protein